MVEFFFLKHAHELDARLKSQFRDKKWSDKRVKLKKPNKMYDDRFWRRNNGYAPSVLLLLSSPSEWIDTMRVTFTDDIHGVFFLCVFYTMHCDKLTMKNDYEIYILFIYNRMKQTQRNDNVIWIRVASSERQQWRILHKFARTRTMSGYYYQSVSARFT